MIIKLTAHVPGQRLFLRKKRTLSAVKIKENFLVETWLGWVQGRAGDYLVELADTIRVPVSEAAFLKEYVLYDPATVCEFCDRQTGPCA